MPNQPRYYGMMLWGNHNICNFLTCEGNGDGLYAMKCIMTDESWSSLWRSTSISLGLQHWLWKNSCVMC